MLIVIPAAGLGTRMGMRPNESKEMLLYNGRPLIDPATNTNYTSVVITREEKQDLIHYLDLVPGVTTQIIRRDGEWADTVYAVKPEYLEDRNCLILPDTRFDHYNATIKAVDLSLKHQEIVLGLHWVDDVSKWGWVDFEEKKIWEKPDHMKGQPGWAWGLIGFTKKNRAHLFQSFSKRIPYKFDSVSYLELEHFEDVTRGQYGKSNGRIDK